ncbi:transcriptional regulator [Halorarius halobius]|uniref:transcriptional regulator n=1 Tax=Halorarius halobius TaxID=2962671 RepID=UPI0020CC56B8|nr:transcriptional regulator [Halorarius halobius]
MQGADRTTRQRIADRLRRESMQASALATEFEVTTESALAHVKHVSESLSGTDERLLVAPPECRDCGFSAFDDPANRPSRCPECKSEAIAEPTFKIE